VSPDGNNVYVSAGELGGVASFGRDQADGTLTEQACITDDGSDGDGGLTCLNGFAPLFESTDVAVSHDGANVYLAISEGTFGDVHGPGAVAVFKRVSGGSLEEFTSKETAKNCNSRTKGCRPGHGLSDALSLTISSDDQNVYVAAQGAGPPGALSIFSRESDGALTQLGCISNDRTDGDGGTCSRAKSFDEPSDVVITEDGLYAYSAAEDDSTVASFRRAPNGRLSQLPGREGCIRPLTSTRAMPCTVGRALYEAGRLAAVDASCDILYAVARDSSAVAVLSRQTDCPLTRRPPRRKG
jgi:6-phosphogluconolactonase (cycloisomerase 2 family)